MDSGSSGSFHSSGNAAADERHDSRTLSISSFFNPIHQPTFFDPSPSSYFPSANFSNLNSVYNPVRSTSIPPDPIFTGFGATQSDSVFLNTQSPVSSNTNIANHHQVGGSTKNPKKRTRASKRAPTTVLTTDTSNFRQMVQEFTGIPTAPLSAAPFRRFDLTGGCVIGPLYPLRSTPRKLQLQQPSIHRFQKQPQTPLNSQNLISLFQRNASMVGTAKSDYRQSDECKLNTSNVHHLTRTDLETFISSRDGGDQTPDNVDSWILPL